MRAADTNVLVRLITRDEVRQVAAAERYVERGALEVARKAGHLSLGTFDRGLAKLDGAERL